MLSNFFDNNRDNAYQFTVTEDALVAGQTISALGKWDMFASHRKVLSLKVTSRAKHSTIKSTPKILITEIKQIIKSSKSKKLKYNNEYGLFSSWATSKGS